VGKKNRNKRSSGKEESAKKGSAQDSFQNTVARLGLGSSNLLNATNYINTRLTQNFQLLNTLYRNSWIAKKVINCIPEDMCKNWFSISAELAPDIQDRYNKLEEKTRVKEKILEGLEWGRLYGGAAALILIDGHEDILEEPLNIDDVMPNSFKGLFIVDRWSGIYPSSELITDINDPDFGLPETYDIRDTLGEVKQKVHHSRIIRFMGRRLPYWEELVEINWGASELEHVYDELAKRDNTSWNIASLVFQANLLINKVDGMDQLLVLSDAQAQQDFYNIKAAQNQLRNSNSMMIIGKEEEVTAMQYTFAGLSDVYNDFMLDISGACEIPVTKLFGRAPAGMNATGESDENNYYDMIGQQQEAVLKPKLMKLLPIMFMSEFGKVPDDLGVKFNPARTPSDDEMAELIGKKVESIDKVYNSGIINQRMALQELHELSYTSNMFSSIREEDIEGASTEYHDENEALYGLDGGEEDGEGLANKPADGAKVPAKT
jgi:phage-related protein (TIGR01555 family)